MVEKKTKSSESTTAKVHKIKANDGAKQVKVVSAKKVSSKKPKQNLVEERSRNPITALVQYFKGAWYELKQVRWPNRASTWSMTLAVLIFTGLFIVLILLLDAGFNWIFNLLLK